MKTVAIISEYNPFHTGHEYQIKKIREEFGQDTRIVAIMSGNYTQRGEIAIMDKSTRAKCAVKCGVNLVLEIPFPYSASSAEFFASSGVKIANELGVVDFLSFGSECGSIDELIQVSTNMLDPEYTAAVINSAEMREVGYPEQCERIYRELFNEKISKSFFSPNNILALEYIKAIISFNSNIKPHTIPRNGASYSEKEITDSPHQSASAIRELLAKDFNSAAKYLPYISVDVLTNEYDDLSYPTDADKLSSAIISHFRLNSPDMQSNIHDAKGGLYNRLYNASFKANTLSSLITLAGTKKYTAARIRRAIWYSFFGVTSSTVKELPAYSQVLAMDEVGMTILKEVKKISAFHILTKPSDYSSLSDAAKSQKVLSDKADSIFHLAKPNPPSGSTSLLTSPYVMKKSIS